MEKGLAGDFCILFSSLGGLYIRHSDSPTVIYEAPKDITIITKANTFCRDQRKSKSVHSSEQSDEEGETIVVGDGVESKVGESTPKAQITSGERGLHAAEPSTSTN